MDRDVIVVELEEEMRRSYLDYAMSVIIGRALPDVRDGLKPVHRRIIYAMYEAGNHYNKPYKKSARIVGEVIGKYHPHGDAPVYEAIVRMAQPFAMRYPLIDGQGNFGSIDGDAPAAMRYTEVRMSKIAHELVADIEKDTVDFVPNYDTTFMEPVVLPTKVPNLLINGSAGIAVGMATKIPPHNLTETIDAIIHLIKHPDATVDDLMKFLPGPDFPTGGIICGTEGIKEAYRTGKGTLILRGRVHVEQERGKPRIVITELPYEVNKARLLEKIAELVNGKKIQGITDIRDESDRHGIRVVIELRRDEDPERIIKFLYRHSQLQINYGIIMLAIVDLQPRLMNLKEVMSHFISHRREVVIRRTRYELEKAERRLHILEGLLKALEQIDEIIETIKKSENVEVARSSLMRKFGFTRTQAQAILEMQLQRLTGLEREKLEEEYRELLKKVEEYRRILGSERVLNEVIIKELEQVKKEYGDKRRTEIREEYEEIQEEELIPDQELVITITRTGYVRRSLLSSYRLQRRGGKGVIHQRVREDDVVEKLFVCNSHSTLLIFTDKGKAYGIKAFEVPETGERSKGRHIKTLLNLSEGETVRAVVEIKEFDEKASIVFITKKGTVKRTALKDFANVRRSGIIAIKLNGEDELFNAVLCRSDDQLLFIATAKGKAIIFPVSQLRLMGRAAAGVRGISLEKEDYVVGADVITENDSYIFTITRRGYGKKTSLDQYRVQGRGGMGVKNANVTARTGEVAASFPVDSDNILVVTKKGKIIKFRSETLRPMGRATQGVRLISLDKDDEVSDAEKFVEE